MYPEAYAAGDDIPRPKPRRRRGRGFLVLFLLFFALAAAGAYFFLLHDRPGEMVEIHPIDAQNALVLRDRGEDFQLQRIQTENGTSWSRVLPSRPHNIHVFPDAIVAYLTENSRGSFHFFEPGSGEELGILKEVALADPTSEYQVLAWEDEICLLFADANGALQRRCVEVPGMRSTSPSWIPGKLLARKGDLALFREWAPEAEAHAYVASIHSGHNSYSFRLPEGGKVYPAGEHVFIHDSVGKEFYYFPFSDTANSIVRFSLPQDSLRPNHFIHIAPSHTGLFFLFLNDSTGGIRFERYGMKGNGPAKLDLPARFGSPEIWKQDSFPEVIHAFEGGGDEPLRSYAAIDSRNFRPLQLNSLPDSGRVNVIRHRGDVFLVCQRPRESILARFSGILGGVYRAAAFPPIDELRPKGKVLWIRSGKYWAVVDAKELTVLKAADQSLLQVREVTEEFRAEMGFEAAGFR